MQDTRAAPRWAERSTKECGLGDKRVLSQGQLYGIKENENKNSNNNEVLRLIEIIPASKTVKEN